MGYLRRYIDNSLDELMRELPALMLAGPRGCGKTTTAARRARSIVRLDRPDEHSTAGLPTVTSLAVAAGIDHRTAASHVDLVEDLRIIERLPAWSSNRCKRLVKTPKYYVVDSAMAAHLAGVDQQAILSSGDLLGRHIDTFVAAHLRPLAALALPQIGMYHMRDANGVHEVDVVLESFDGRVIGMEVKAAAAVTPRDERHLEWLRDQVGPAFHRGLVLHTGPDVFSLSERIWAVPISLLWGHGSFALRG